MKSIKIKRGHWPSGISNGLTIHCSVCGDIPKFDYRVKDELWIKIIPKAFRRGAICLPCLDKLAVEKGIDIGKGLISFQYTGINKTIELVPVTVYYYKKH